MLNSDVAAYFGDIVTYTSLVAGSFPIKFATPDKNRVELEPFSNQYTVRWANLAEFPGSTVPASGDTFVMAGRTYKVVKLQFEDNGGGVYIGGDRQ